MFIDQRTKNSLMRELDFIERTLTLPYRVEPEHVREVQDRLDYIRQMLTDQQNQATAVPE